MFWCAKRLYQSIETENNYIALFSLVLCGNLSHNASTVKNFSSLRRLVTLVIYLGNVCDESPIAKIFTVPNLLEVLG